MKLQNVISTLEFTLHGETYENVRCDVNDRIKFTKKSKCVWSGYTTITNCRQPRGTARKSCSTVTRHQEDKLSKATSSLFPIKSFACLVTWCQLDNLQIKKRPIIFVMQSNIASKPSTLMPRYTTTENKQLTSLRAVEFVSLVYVQCKTNLVASEHAFS